MSKAVFQLKALSSLLTVFFIAAVSAVVPEVTHVVRRHAGALRAGEFPITGSDQSKQQREGQQQAQRAWRRRHRPGHYSSLNCSGLSSPPAQTCCCYHRRSSAWNRPER